MHRLHRSIIISFVFGFLPSILLVISLSLKIKLVQTVFCLIIKHQRIFKSSIITKKSEMRFKVFICRASYLERDDEKESISVRMVG